MIEIHKTHRYHHFPFTFTISFHIEVLGYGTVTATVGVSQSLQARNIIHTHENGHVHHIESVSDDCGTTLRDLD